MRITEKIISDVFQCNSNSFSCSGCSLSKIKCSESCEIVGLLVFRNMLLKDNILPINKMNIMMRCLTSDDVKYCVECELEKKGVCTGLYQSCFNMISQFYNKHEKK